MLKTNSKKVRINVQEYIMNNTHDDEGEFTFLDVNKALNQVLKEFKEQALYSYNLNLLKLGRASMYDIFEDWAKGLPNGTFDFWYRNNAKDILAGILEMNKDEKSKLIEQDSQQQLTKLIYKEVEDLLYK